MGKNGERILLKLSGAVPGDLLGPCPSPEDISALIDGTIKKDLKEKVQSHISSCEVCYETYISVLELTGSSDKKNLRIFSPLSIAASIFIALVAFVIFYKVNINVKDTIKPASPFSNSPVVIKEEKIEHKSGKKRISTSPGKKREKKRVLKQVVPEKLIKAAEMEEVIIEDEVPEKKDEPPEIKSKMILRNTQNISQSGNEPDRPAAALSVGTVNIEKGGSDQKSGRQSTLRKKGGKGLVDELKESEERDKNKSTGMNCFRREGDEYKRREEFKTNIPLRDTFPKIKKLVQPENYKSDDPITKQVYVIIEVLADKNGNVLKVCVAGGHVENIKLVVEAVKKWKFEIRENSPARFRMTLGVSGNRIIEVLDKK